MLADDIFRRVEEEAQGTVNRFYAGQALGREPDSAECMLHFLEHGGEEELKKRMGIAEERQVARESA